MYEFTNKWFENTAKMNWDALVQQFNPTTILEIGSYEGMSTCYLIERLGNIKPLEIYCIDTWEGGAEHKLEGVDMDEVEKRFDGNLAYAMGKSMNEHDLTKLKGYSEEKLMELYFEDYRDYFDFIYVDGSHATIDILSDAVLSFKLLKSGGVMIFDDYLWAAGVKNIDYFPKLAIDAFTTVFANKIKMVNSLNTQIIIIKL